MRFGPVIIIISALVYVHAKKKVCVNVSEDENLVKLTLGIRQFSKVFLKHFKENKIGNYVVSPLSLHLALSMITIGTGGSTSSELHKALGTDHIKNIIFGAYKVLTENLWVNKKPNKTLYSKLQLHQKIWLPKNLIPNPEFVSALRKGFVNAAIGVPNLIKTQSTVEVPKWGSPTFFGESFTNLKKLGQIFRNNSLIISSELSFKGDLANKLKVKYISLGKFYINETLSKDVPMIHVNGPVIYGLLPKIRASFIKYDFMANELSMIIIRSNNIRDFAILDQQLENINISFILKRGNFVNMSFYLPRFKVESTIELKEIVKKMGVVEIFNPSANFSGISAQGLKVDQIIQKISVDINENGAKATSSSDIRYSRRISMNRTESFGVNAPFHFVVLHERTKLPMIYGRITYPVFN